MQKILFLLPGVICLALMSCTYSGGRNEVQVGSSEKKLVYSKVLLVGEKKMFTSFADVNADGKLDMILGTDGHEFTGDPEAVRCSGEYGEEREYVSFFLNRSVDDHIKFDEPYNPNAHGIDGQIPGGWSHGTFSPQVGDFDGDGQLEIVSGSNCCGIYSFHWFDFATDGMLSKRFDGEFSIDESKYRINGKSESRPFVLDWDRDGNDDLVFVLCESVPVWDEVTQTTKYRFQYRIFANTNSQTRTQQIEEGRIVKEQPDSMRAGGYRIGSPKNGYDLRIALTAFEIQYDDFNRNPRANKPGAVHFSFVDFDGDGNKDLLYSESEYSRDLVIREQGSFRAFRKIDSAIYWMRNLTSEGLPRFDRSQRVYTFPQDWIVESISAADLDDDGKVEVVANVFRGTTVDTISELWLLSLNRVAVDSSD